jgi:ABC-type transport system involved in multi-copper enzyme maturation permease subunit
MSNLMKAELQKIVGHRWVVGLLIWIFPVGALAASLLLILASLLSPQGLGYFGLSNIKWTSQMLNVWSFPNSSLGRLMLIGFIAFVFAGEFQWDTWKNILPYNSRARFILVKFLAVGLLILIAFVTMSVIWGVGPGVAVTLVEGSYGPLLTNVIVMDFAGDYIIKVLLTFTAIMISAGYTAIGSVITRSVLGSALVGFGAILLEELSVGIFLAMSTLLRRPGILNLYRLTPTYNIYNVSSWVSSNHPYFIQIPGFEHITTDTLTFSGVVLVLWALTLIGITAVLFQRKDIT